MQVKAESSAPCAILTVRSDSGVAEDTVYISSAACSYYSYFDRYRHDAGELPEGGGGGGSAGSVMELELETAPDFAATPIAKRVRLVVSSRSPIAEGVVTSEIAAAQLQCALSGTVVDVGSESPSAVLVRLLGHNVTLYVLGVDFDEVAAAPGLPCSAPLYARIEKGSTALAVVLKHPVPITSLPQQSPRTSRPIADALASTAEGTSKFYTAWWQDAFQSMSAILHRGGSTAAGSQATPTQMVLVTGELKRFTTFHTHTHTHTHTHARTHAQTHTHTQRSCSFCELTILHIFDLYNMTLLPLCGMVVFLKHPSCNVWYCGVCRPCRCR